MIFSKDYVGYLARQTVKHLVDAKMIDDKVSAKVARDIAKKIESEMQYPGEIKVTVLREVQSPKEL